MESGLILLSYFVYKSANTITAENNKKIKELKEKINMNKNEMINKIQETVDFEVTKKDLAQIVDAYTKVIKEAVLAGDTVTIPEICKISSKDVAERSGVTKLGDVEKAWTKPAHKEACVKTLKSFKNIFEA